MAITSKKDTSNAFKRIRGHLIARARYEAALIATSTGTVHARQVRDRIRDLGLLHQTKDERWLGGVFPGKHFIPTGEYLCVDDASPRTRPGDGGGRPIKIWKLKSGAQIPDIPEWSGEAEHVGLHGNEPNVYELEEAISEIEILKKLAGININGPAFDKVNRWLKQILEEKKLVTLTSNNVE